MDPLLAVRLMHSSNGLLEIRPLVEDRASNHVVRMLSLVSVTGAKLFPSRKMVDAPVMQLSEELTLLIHV